MVFSYLLTRKWPKFAACFARNTIRVDALVFVRVPENRESLFGKNCRDFILTSPSHFRLFWGSTISRILN
jgi:hypothetical protein